MLHTRVHSKAGSTCIYRPDTRRQHHAGHATMTFSAPFTTPFVAPTRVPPLYPAAQPAAAGAQQQQQGPSSSSRGLFRRIYIPQSQRWVQCRSVQLAALQRRRGAQQWLFIRRDGAIGQVDGRQQYRPEQTSTERRPCTRHKTRLPA